MYELRGKGGRLNTNQGLQLLCTHQSWYETQKALNSLNDVHLLYSLYTYEYKEQDNNLQTMKAQSNDDM